MTPSEAFAPQAQVPRTQFDWNVSAMGYPEAMAIHLGKMMRERRFFVLASHLANPIYIYIHIYVTN